VSAAMCAVPCVLSHRRAWAWVLVLLSGLLTRPALADVILADQGGEGARLRRLTDTGALVWSSPITQPLGAVLGLTLAADGATALATVQTATGGDVLQVDAATGAVIASFSAASFGGAFTGPTPILAAADGTYWLARSGQAGGPGLLFHLGGDLAPLAAGTPVAGLGDLTAQALALTPAGDPLLLLCCQAPGGRVALFDAGDPGAAPTLLPAPPSLGGGLLRGLLWQGSALLVGVAGSGDPADPGGGALLRYSRAGGGDWDAPSVLVAPFATAAADFSLLATDPAGALWLGGVWSPSLTLFAADGTLRATAIDGLTQPAGLLYIPMPEPGSLALLGVGLAALLLRRMLARG
jgi:PEP-CTERM motif